MLLLHGRHDPEEEMQDWGFNGPIIPGIIAVHYTYGGANIFFESVSAANHAQELTGWDKFDDHALKMNQLDDVVFIDHPELGRCYFGDWEFQSKTPDGREV
jgi:hypothetical protein